MPQYENTPPALLEGLLYHCMIKFNKESEFFFSTETGSPTWKWDLSVHVPGDCQHDGHPWDDEFTKKTRR